MPLIGGDRPGDDFNGSIGLPISSTIITIRDDDGNALPQGQSGEICVAGPQVMRCYWNRPDETAKVMLPDQVLRTGDIGYMDAKGFVYIEDRKKDMILVSGFNVYPNEVEGVAVTHPGVLEVAAVAQPDERAGEVVALFVVRKDPSLTEEALIEHCRKSLTGYKVPKRVHFKDELPKTNVGKILRRELKDSLKPQPEKPVAAAPVVAPQGRGGEAVDADVLGIEVEQDQSQHDEDHFRHVFANFHLVRVFHVGQVARIPVFVFVFLFEFPARAEALDESEN